MSTIKRSFKQALKDARPPERTVPICLNVGITAEIEQLRRQLDDMASQPSRAKLSGDPANKIREQIRLLEEQSQDATWEFRLRALPRHRYSELTRQHLPRDDDPADKAVGFNRDTFYPALVKACTVEPELDAEDWLELIGDGTDENPGKLSPRQFDELGLAAYKVNRWDVDVPLLLPASEKTTNSAPA